MTKMTWLMIRDTLSKEIHDGVLEPGDRLPTEPALAARFGVGRHSVRRAIEKLAVEGKLSVEQGRGTYIASAPRLAYSIGKRTRLRTNLLPQGYDVSASLIRADTVDATDEVHDALRLAPGALVIESQRITKANDVPIAFGASYHDATRFADYIRRREDLGSTTATYKSYGIADYVRGETTIYARPARAEEARTLRQHPDMPVMVARAIDTELDGTPLSYSRVIWSSARVTFSITREEDG